MERDPHRNSEAGGTPNAVDEAGRVARRGRIAARNVDTTPSRLILRIVELPVSATYRVRLPRGPNLRESQKSPVHAGRPRILFFAMTRRKWSLRRWRSLSDGVVTPVSNVETAGFVCDQAGGSIETGAGPVPSSARALLPGAPANKTAVPLVEILRTLWALVSLIKKSRPG